MSRESLFLLNLELDDAHPGAGWRHRWVGRIRVVLVLMLIAVVLGGPWIAWRFTPARRIGVVVVDKTVAHPNWREHAAFTWWLVHRRVATPAGALYVAESGYVGYHPLEHRGDTLNDAMLSGARMAYIADTYGVYRGDYVDTLRGGAFDSTRAGLERSQLVYGGIQVSEIDALTRFRAAGGVIGAEFNTIASPAWRTPGGRAAEALFGVRHDGWVARWFLDLSSTDEVARWMRNQYRRRHGQDWSFTGPGVVFVSETDDRIAVLRPAELDGPFPVTVDVDSANDPVVAAVRSGRPYWYWFEGLALSPQVVALASVVVHANAAGKAMLEHEGFPARTAALVRHINAPLMVFSAIELADIGDQLPSLQRTRGLDWRQRFAARRDHTQGQTSDAFWHVSVPVWDALLRAAEHPPKRP